MPLPRFLSFGRDPFDPTHRFATSWLLPPAALFAIRALFVSQMRCSSPGLASIYLHIYVPTYVLPS